MTRRLRFVATTFAAALVLAACANNDAKESDVVNAMTDSLSGDDGNAGDLTDTQVKDIAECVGAGFQREFGDDQDLFNDLAAAETPDEFPGDTQATVEDIFDECEVPHDGGDTTDGSGGTADTTDTTEQG